MDKFKRTLTTVPTCIWWLSDRVDKYRRKKRAKHGADAIDNLERLHRLKERGAITDADYNELKAKLKAQI